MSLNPYYTGIHLHNQENVAVYLCNVLILIILEYIYMPVLNLIAMNPFSSLNPYYTGIHLHLYIANEEEQQFYVLILIILEYIYIALATLKELNVCVS